MKKIIIFCLIFLYSCANPSSYTQNSKEVTPQNIVKEGIYPPQQNSVDTVATSYTRKCNRYDWIWLDHVSVFNNAWGIERVQNWQMCIFGSTWSKKGKIDLGWTWDISRQIRGGVTAYPSIGYGYQPWCRLTKCIDKPKLYLPLKINHVKNLNIDFDISSSGTGRYNVLLDMWITRTDDIKNWKVPEQIADEIGWFVDNQNWPRNSGTYYGLQDFGIDGKWHVYNFKNHKCWTATKCKDFIQFRPHVKNSKRKLHLKIWIDYMVQKGWIDRNHYISSIRLGNETLTGKGETTINRFNLEHF